MNTILIGKTEFELVPQYKPGYIGGSAAPGQAPPIFIGYLLKPLPTKTQLN